MPVRRELSVAGAELDRTSSIGGVRNGGVVVGVQRRVAATGMRLLVRTW